MTNEFKDIFPKKHSIIGSYFKKDGHWGNDVEYDRVAKLMEVVNKK